MTLVVRQLAEAATRADEGGLAEDPAGLRFVMGDLHDEELRLFGVDVATEGEFVQKVVDWIMLPPALSKPNRSGEDHLRA